MLISKAWNELTKNQQILYVYCKAQYYAEKKKEKPEQFTMNQSKWCSMYGLYSKGNARSFYKDMSALIDKGFVDCIACGADARIKTIYAFSSRWLKYGTSEYCVPETVKTYAYTGTRARNKKV